MPTLPEGHVLSPRRRWPAIAAADGRDSVTWLGHACVPDPARRAHHADRSLPDRARLAASLVRPAASRGAGPAAASCSTVDILLLSHNHYDHLDLRALAQLRGTERDPRGHAAARVTLSGHWPLREAVELDWLQRIELAGVRITALPAIHFSKRGLFDRNASLWCGFLLEAADRTILFTGDTAYGPVFAEMAPRVPPPDLALVPIGAYEPRTLMEGSHCTPEEGVRIGRDLRRTPALRHALGHHPAHRRAPVRASRPVQAAAVAAGYAEEDAWTLAIGETRTL